MGISLKHPEFLVPADCRHLGNVEPLLEQSSHCLVPKVVKMQIVHSCSRTQVLEGKTDRIAGDGKDAL